MSWTTVSSKATVALARQATPDFARRQATAQRHSLPRHLFHHPRRSRLLSPAQRLSISTSSISEASSKSKTSRSTSNTASTEEKVAHSVRVTDKRNPQTASTASEASSRTPPPETVLEVDDVAQSSKQAQSSSGSTTSSTTASTSAQPSAQSSNSSNRNRCSATRRAVRSAKPTGGQYSIYYRPAAHETSSSSASSTLRNRTKGSTLASRLKPTWPQTCIPPSPLLQVTQA